MKKLVFIIIIVISLISFSSCNSCNKKGTSFEKDDLEGFLTALDKHNFTVEYTYQLFNGGICLYDVESVFKINDKTIYHEVNLKYTGTNEVVITTKKYVHYEKGTYYKYLYQNDTTENPKKMYITKEETDETRFKNEVKYGIDFIFNPILSNFKYNQSKEEFKYKSTTIKIEDDKIYVNNPDGNSMTGNKNFKATYSLINSTDIKTPDFVKNYKGDIYE